MALPPISPTGVATPYIYPTQTAQGPGLSAAFGALPGSINPPIIWEPGPELTGNRRQIFIIATGRSADWGGAEVHVSIDNVTYFASGTIASGGTQGLLTATFASGADPDTANTLSVDVSESRSQVIAGTAQDADDYLSLAYVDGEIIGYSAATLTGVGLYDLGSYLRRGVYDPAAIASHAAGTQFGLINGSTYREEYSKRLVGKTIFFKFPSFNTLGGQFEDIATVPFYTYTLTGIGGGFAVRRVPQGAAATLLASDYLLEVVVGVLAPTPIAGVTGDRFAGERYEIKDKNNNAGTYPIILTPQSPELIDGDPSYSMTTSNGAIVITWDGVEWSVT
jgi:hypothetical protein